MPPWSYVLCVGCECLLVVLVLQLATAGSGSMRRRSIPPRTRSLALPDQQQGSSKEHQPQRVPAEASSTLGTCSQHRGADNSVSQGACRKPPVLQPDLIIVTVTMTMTPLLTLVALGVHRP